MRPIHMSQPTEVFSLQTLSDGRLAVGTLGHGVLLFDEESLAPGGEPHAALTEGLAVWALAQSAAGELLVGTSAWGNYSVPEDGNENNPGVLLFPHGQQVNGGQASAVLAQGSIVWSLAMLQSGDVAVGGSDEVMLFALRRKSSEFVSK